MFTLFVFIAVLAILVLSHEFGHFIVARRNGILVEEFGFGFPPRIVGIRRLVTPWGKKWQVIWNKKQLKETVEHHTGTLYSINLIPLGGFVKIKGETGAEDGNNDPDSFAAKKVWQKAAVLSAGVLMNILLAAVLLSIGYMVGMPQVGDEVTDNGELQIVQVLPGKPAAEAGLKVGDKIIQIDGEKNLNVVKFQEYVNAHRGGVAVTVLRDGKTEVLNLHPSTLDGSDRVGIGVGIVNIGIVRYPWYKAIYHGFVATGNYLVMIFVGLYGLIKGLFVGANLEGQVAGPVGVAVLTGEAARMGFSYLIQLTALLSLNLAAVNILPIPALDGGRLFFLLWNKIFPRRISPNAEQLAHTIGFALLMLLVVVVTASDVGIFKGSISLWWSKLFKF